MTDTIFALSSGAPPAAIAVIRISGPAAIETAEGLAGSLREPRKLSLRRLVDPKSGEALDRGLLAWFPASGSVTGEPLVELHVHGGRATVDRIEATLGGLGLRRARGGEFTWRAFENGKMDLLQVEALSDLLRAETETQRRTAIAGEGLSADVERWRRDVLILSALVEAALDQSDEDDVPADRGRIDVLSNKLVGEIGEVLRRPGSERLFDGIRIVFAGPPNAGKSSLINALSGREVAITSDIAGTTRDVIEAPVNIDGVAYIFTDTAGLRDDADDPIEREGIDRASRRVAHADILIWLGDDAPPEHPCPILLHARADEPSRQKTAPDRLRVSSATGEGLVELVGRISAEARALLPREGDAALSRRQRLHLSDAHAALAAFAASEDELIGAEYLRTCRHAFDALTGRAGTEEMLDALFATFCVGK